MTKTTIDREDAQKVADAILTAAGSGFRHYMPSSKERIIEAAQEALDEFLSKIARVG